MQWHNEKWKWWKDSFIKGCFFSLAFYRQLLQPNNKHYHPAIFRCKNLVRRDWKVELELKVSKQKLRSRCYLNLKAASLINCKMWIGRMLHNQAKILTTFNFGWLEINSCNIEEKLDQLLVRLQSCVAAIDNANVIEEHQFFANTFELDLNRHPYPWYQKNWHQKNVHIVKITTREYWLINFCFVVDLFHMYCTVQ